MPAVLERKFQNFSSNSERLSNIPQTFHHKQPHRQRKRTEQGGHHHGTSGNGAVMLHIFRHDKTAARGGTSQHHQNGDQLFRAESQPDRCRQEQGTEQEQLCGRNAQRQPQLALGILQPE